MKKDDLYQKLTDIEVALGKISVHLEDIKSDIHDIKKRELEMERKVAELEEFRASAKGMAGIILPMVTVCGGFVGFLLQFLIKGF